jgi:leucyl-tRNA synthetase
MGIYRFLQRCWRLLLDDTSGEERLRELVDGPGTAKQARLRAQTIAGVTEEIENMRFNTAISKLMVLVRDIAKDAPLPREAAEALVLLLAPLAPHLAEELWQRLGHPDTLAYEPWPVADESLLVEDEITIVAQVNGKKRDELRVPKDATRDQIEALALASERVQSHLGGREPKKVIVVPGRLVNIVG